MLKNYLTIAFRTIRRSPLYAALNVFGLAVGIAACILIALYIRDELSFDRMHDDADRIYRVVEERTAAGERTQHFVYTRGALGPELVNTLPGVELSARAVSAWSTGRRVVQREGVRFYVGDHLYAEPAFFDLFDFPFVAGRREGALDEPLEVVLTEESAQTYFGNEDPIGKTMAVESMGDFTVTGVVRIPANTHVDHSMFFSFATLGNWGGFWDWANSWRSDGIITYIRLAPGADPDAIDASIAKITQEKVEDEPETTRRAYLQPLTDIHLGSGHIEFDVNRNPGRPIYLYLFGVVALFVIAIGAINYTTMATAGSLGRAREIGVRKSVGANRRQLILQFLAETALVTAIALVLSVLLVLAALPTFNAVADKSIVLDASAIGWLGLSLLLLGLLVALAAGGYPAFHLSKFRPAGTLRGFESGGGALSIRQGLVVLQFVMSITLIVATIVVHDQLEYVQTKNMGYDEEQLVVVDINSGEVRSSFEAVKQAFAAVPGVTNVSASNRVPGDWKNITQVDVVLPGGGQLATVNFLGVDEDFLDTYDMELAAGRGFGEGFGTDSTSVLINETASRQLELNVGDRLSTTEPEFEAEVVGIVRDFHFESLHRPIGPMVLGFHFTPIDRIDYFTVRVQGAAMATAIEGLAAVGERFDPEHPFEYNILEQRLMDSYVRERRVSQIFGAAALLAVIVACLGLFGLAAYSARQRTKEIGVRKVLGATVSNLVGLLSREFVKLVLIAVVIATPLAYFATRWWLQDFAYRTEVGPAIFVIAGSMALLLALATVSYHAFRTATANPIESLRYE